MRNIAFIFVAFVMLLSSCSSDDGIVIDENTQVSTTQDIQININVADPTADELTRASVKTCWADGDVIQIWFGTNVQDFKNSGKENPDIVIKYEKGKWVKDETAVLSGRTVNGATTMKSVYNGYVKVASVDDFTYSNNTLSATIQNWKFLTKVQVVITGLASANAANYKLACDKFLPCTGFHVNVADITTAEGTANGETNGISNDDGVAFVFAGTNTESAATYIFTLEDYATGTTKTYTVSNKTLKLSDSAILGLKISESKFTSVTANLLGVGVAEYDGGKVKWVQLWENGPKFAEYNVGATRETEFGNYYTWGGSNSISSTSYANNSKPAYKNTGNDQLSGNFDTATSVWGDNWRMITKSEFDYMVETERVKTGGTVFNPTYETRPKNLTITWEVVDGVMGCRFTGKDAYSHNSVFFPAAGSYNSYGVQSGVGKTGFYWSSNPEEGGANKTTTNAKYLQVSGNILFDGSVSGFTYKVEQMARQSAGSVRAVLK